LAGQLELGAMEQGGELIAVVGLGDIINVLSNQDTKLFFLFGVLESPMSITFSLESVLFQNFQLQPFPPDSLYVLAKTPLFGSYKFFLGFLWNFWSIFQISTFTHFFAINYTHRPRRERGDNFTKPES